MWSSLRNGRGAFLASLLAASATAGCNNIFGIVGPEPTSGASASAGASGAGGTVNSSSVGSGAQSTGGAGGSASCVDSLGAEGSASKWVAQPIGNYLDAAQAIARHPGGDIFVSGFYNSEDFIVKSAPPLPRSGPDDREDIFVARYAHDTGAVVWATGLPGVDTQWVTSMTADPSGSPIVGGYFLGSFKAGNDTLEADEQFSANATEGFVFKLDPDSGARLWGKQFGGASADVVMSVAADSQGNVLVAGASIPVTDMGEPPMMVPVDYGCGPRTLVQGVPWAFLTKLDKAGNCVWDRQYVMDTRYGGIFSKFGLAVAVAANDDIVLTGGFAGIADFGTRQITAIGNKDVFVLRTDSKGEVLWAQNYGDGNYQIATTLTVAPDGDIWLGGWFQLSVTLGALPIEVDPKADPDNVKAFVAKLHVDAAKPNEPAEPVFLRPFTDSGTLNVTSLAVTPAGEAVIGGTVIAAKGATGVDFGDGKKLLPGAQNVDGSYHDDAFIAKYCKGGDLLWVKHFATANYEQVLGLTVGADGNIFATGAFDGSNDFGTGKSIMGYGLDPYTLAIGP